MSGEADRRPVLRLLQISGLAPYVLGRDPQHSRLSLALASYNVLLSFAVMYNAVYAETDLKNNVDYANKSFLIGIAFDVVDVLENIHFSFVSLRSLLVAKVGIGVWFKLKRINGKLSDLSVEFDERKFTKYIYLKTTAFLGMAIAFLAIDIYLCTRLGLFYTLNYWILCAVPLLFNGIVSISFGGMLLLLYQRFWVINEFIGRYTDRCRNKEETPSSEDGWAGTRKWQHGSLFAGDEALASILLGGKTSKKVFMPRAGKKAQPRGPRVPEAPKRRPPEIVMLKNYGECFAKAFCDKTALGVIRSLKIVHFDLFEVANDLNSIFGWNLLFIFTASFFGCTINTYFVIIFHLRTYEVEQYVSSVTWTALYLFKIFYLTIHATKVSQEACRTIHLLHILLNQTDLNDTQLQAEVKAFCLQISQCKVEFKAAEFFTVDSAILFQFVAGVLSNVIFVVQFDKINFSKR